MVIANLRLEWNKIYKPKTDPVVKYCTDELRNEKTRNEYICKLNEHWENIKKAIKDAAGTVLTRMKSDGKNNNNDNAITKFSKRQKSVKIMLKQTSDTQLREKLSTERKSIMRSMKKFLCQKEEQKVNNLIQEIEEAKDDPTRYFKVIQQLQSIEPTKPLVIDNGDQKFVDQQDQANLIANFFKRRHQKPYVYAPTDGYPI